MREMKNSGTEWLSDIPHDWTLSNIGSLYTMRNVKVSDRDYPPLSVTMKGVVPNLKQRRKLMPTTIENLLGKATLQSTVVLTDAALVELQIEMARYR